MIELYSPFSRQKSRHFFLIFFLLFLGKEPISRLLDYDLSVIRASLPGDEAEKWRERYVYSGTPCDKVMIQTHVDGLTDFEIKTILQARGPGYTLGGSSAEDVKKRANALKDAIWTDGFPNSGICEYMYPDLLNKLIKWLRDPSLRQQVEPPTRPVARGRSTVTPPAWVTSCEYSTDFVKMIEVLPYLSFKLVVDYVHVKKKVNIPSSLQGKGWGGLIWTKALKKNAYEWLYAGFKNIKFNIDEKKREATLSVSVNPSFKSKNDQAVSALKYLTACKCRYAVNELDEMSVVEVLAAFCECWAGTDDSCHHIVSNLACWTDMPR